jgi:hypothetical protein
MGSVKNNHIIVLCLLLAGVCAFGYCWARPSISQGTQFKQQSSTGITFVSVEGAGPGDCASVTVRVVPNAECLIVYLTPSGRISKAHGLGSTVADANGQASWTWCIGSHTRPGTGHIIVTCNGERAETDITIP